MALSEDLQKKLTADLVKSGFNSEMTVGRLLSDGKWLSEESGYFDLDEEIMRSIDASATCVFEIGYSMQIEVKKSEQPWVVFKKEGSVCRQDFWKRPHFAQNVRIEKFADFESAMNLLPPYGRWLGHGVHEAFKKPNEAGRWYAAAVTVAKAAYSACEQAKKVWLSSYPPTERLLMLTHPVVVLDGVLITVEQDKKGQQVLNEVDFAPMSLEFGTSKYERSVYHVDLVTIKGLSIFLEQVKAAAKEAERIVSVQPPLA